MNRTKKWLALADFDDFIRDGFECRMTQNQGFPSAALDDFNHTPQLDRAERYFSTPLI
jgi:hypothetical protein